MNDLILDDQGYAEGNWSRVVFDIQRELRRRRLRSNYLAVADLTGLTVHVVRAVASSRNRVKKTTACKLIELRDRVMSGRCMCGCERET